MTIFTDQDTIPTVTTPSATDISAFVESATINPKTTPSGVDIYGQNDLATVNPKTSLSSVEIYGASDVRTIGTVTSITSIDSGPYYDSASPRSVLKVSVGYEVHTHPAGFWGPFDTDDGRLI